MRLLLVEDDESLAKALCMALQRRGYQVGWVADGVQALMRLRDDAPDLAILDLEVPGIDGLQVLHRARSQGVVVPIVVVSGRGGIGDRVQALNAGADDYVSKPFALEELLARLRALLRREHEQPRPARTVCGRLSMEAATGEIQLDGAPLRLTAREQAMVGVLMRQPGRAVPKDRLFRLVYPDQDNVRFDAIDVLAHRVRRKLAGTGVSLVTLRGLGYALKALPDCA
jgi:two-component system response regulator TctD